MQYVQLEPSVAHLLECSPQRLGSVRWSGRPGMPSSVVGVSVDQLVRLQNYERKNAPAVRLAGRHGPLQHRGAEEIGWRNA